MQIYPDWLGECDGGAGEGPKMPAPIVVLDARYPGLITTIQAIEIPYPGTLGTIKPVVNVIPLPAGIVVDTVRIVYPAQIIVASLPLTSVASITITSAS